MMLSFYIKLFILISLLNAIDGLTKRNYFDQNWNITQVDRLKQDLLSNYDKFSRPSAHDKQTTCELGIDIMHLEVEESRSAISVYGHLYLLWTDEKLRWDPKDYQGLDVLYVNEFEIWIPDIYLINSAVSYPVGHFSFVYLLVFPNGKVLWVPPVQLIVLCDLNLKRWPYDSQQCELKLVSWSYNGDSLDLVPSSISNGSANLRLAVNNSEWQLEDYKLKRVPVKHSYVDLTDRFEINVQLKFHRRSPIYHDVFITPLFEEPFNDKSVRYNVLSIIHAVFISVLTAFTLSTFLLPPHTYGRLILNCGSIIISCIFLLYFAKKIPNLGNTTPLLVIVYNIILIMVAFSLIESTFVTWINKSKHSNCVPMLIKKYFLDNKLGMILGFNNELQKISNEEIENRREEYIEENEDGGGSGFENDYNPADLEWRLFGNVLDMLFFLVYSIIFGLLCLIKFYEHIL